MERLNVSDRTSLVEPAPLTERQMRLNTCRVSVNAVIHVVSYCVIVHAKGVVVH